MDKKVNKDSASTKKGTHEHSLPHEIDDKQRKLNEAAHSEADHDMEEDAELTASSPNDDLDEGETARLGEKTDLI